MTCAPSFLPSGRAREVCTIRLRDRPPDVRLARSFSRVGLVLCLCMVRPARTGAEEVVVPAQRDNVLYESSDGSLSNGQGEYLFAGRTNQAQYSTRRTLVRFDPAGYVPPGATVMAVELGLFLARTSSVFTETVSVHRVLQDWGEGTSSTPGGGGGGDTAETNDATWLHTFYATDFWAAPGGRFVPVASASVAVDTASGYKTWTSEELTGDVRFFLASPDSSFGWILLGNEAIPGSVRKFASREHADSAHRPLLKLYLLGNCPIARTGDLNGDYTITAADILVLVDFVFKAGSDPVPCEAAGDVNCSGHVTAADIIKLVDTVFRSGQAPCDACDLVPASWSCP